MYFVIFKFGLQAEAFAEFLRSKGHTVTFSTTDDTVVDGVSAFSNDETRELVNDLWEEFGRS